MLHDPPGSAGHENRPTHPNNLLIGDQLEMLVTSEPVAELDDALAWAVAQRNNARRTGNTLAITRLTAWIDQRLDERHALRATHQPPPTTAEAAPPT
ncbi:MAG: hypothetical protein GEV12_10915 [Micromonosporaceae bacterium]|nr:hypothetical protein [Micromonosporaceae bacterium]